MKIMPTQSLSNAYAKERKAYYYEKNDPLKKIIRLMNHFWAIDKMYATKEEKTWAKNRLETQILGILRHTSTAIHGSIKASFKSKAVWDDTREYLS